MAIVTTSLNMTTTPAAIITTAQLRNASVNDPVPLSVFNESGVRVYLGGTALSTLTSITGMPLLSSEKFSGVFLASDQLFGVTSASTATLRVMIGRQ